MSDDDSDGDSSEVNPLRMPTSEGARAEKGRFNSDESEDSDE